MALGAGKRKTGRPQERNTQGVTGIDHVPFPKLGGGFMSVHFMIRFHSLHTTWILCICILCIKNSKGHKMNFIEIF